MATQTSTRTYFDLIRASRAANKRLADKTFEDEIASIIRHISGNRLGQAVQELEALREHCNGFLKAVVSLINSMSDTEYSLQIELLTMRRLALEGAKQFALATDNTAVVRQMEEHLNELDEIVAASIADIDPDRLR